MINTNSRPSLPENRRGGKTSQVIWESFQEDTKTIQRQYEKKNTTVLIKIAAKSLARY